MKRLILLLLFVPSLAFAQWTNEERAWLAASSAALAADWAQTRYIAQHPQQFHELNPVLGLHPSVGRVNNYFLGALVGNYLVADYLSGQRRNWLVGVTVLEGVVVARNMGLGVRMSF